MTLAEMLAQYGEADVTRWAAEGRLVEALPLRQFVGRHYSTGTDVETWYCYEAGYGELYYGGTEMETPLAALEYANDQQAGA